MLTVNTTPWYGVEVGSTPTVGSMKITVIYDDGSDSPASHTLKYRAGDLEEAQHISKRLATEGFYKRVDDSLGYYIPPARIFRVVVKSGNLGVVDGEGLA